MPTINFNHPEIDPKKVEMFGPIDQPGDHDNREDREFITPEGTAKAMDLIKKQLEPVMKNWGLIDK